MRQDLKEVVVLSEVLGGIVRVLERTELHLRFQEGGAVGLIAWMLQVRDALLRAIRPEGHKGAQQLGVE